MACNASHFNGDTNPVNVEIAVLRVLTNTTAECKLISHDGSPQPGLPHSMAVSSRLAALARVVLHPGHLVVVLSCG